MRIITLVLLSSALSFAGTWSGTLVDAGCWRSAENNAGHATPSGSRDRNRQVSLCSPKAKTKSFAVLTPDGIALGLDAAGNIRASELAEAAHRKAPIRVVVSGELHKKNSIQVSSISAAK